MAGYLSDRGGTDWLVLDPAVMLNVGHEQGSLNKMTAWIIQEIQTWVVQGAQYDIVAQGRDRDDAIRCWRLCVRGAIELDKRAGREPLQTYSPAPGFYWKRFGQPEEIDILGPLPERHRVQSQGINTP